MKLAYFTVNKAVIVMIKLKFNRFVLLITIVLYIFVFTACGDSASLDEITGLVSDGLDDLGNLVEEGVSDIEGLVGNGASGTSSGASNVASSSGGSSGGNSGGSNSSGESTVNITSESDGSVRDNTSVVYVPTAAGTATYEGTSAVIDTSNANEGYIMVKYIGEAGAKVKMQLTLEGSEPYTYNLTKPNEFETFPLVKGSGKYSVTINLNITGNQYAVVDSTTFEAQIASNLSAYLYPNQYVNFNASSNAVQVAKDLASGATSDLEVVERVYNHIISNITYDYALAESVGTNYLPVVDNTLATGKGICFDYASLMAAMLRSQGIPTQLVIGYAGSTYHAWVSVYTPETGWIYNMFEFDGYNWVRMDPTFAASNDNNNAILQYIGDGSNYNAMYFY